MTPSRRTLLVALLALAHVGAALPACPPPASADAHGHAHGHHAADEEAPAEPAWTADCPCGCEDAPASGGPSARLRLGPPAAAPDLPRPFAFAREPAPDAALPAAPVRLHDPVPI